MTYNMPQYKVMFLKAFIKSLQGNVKSKQSAYMIIT